MPPSSSRRAGVVVGLGASAGGIEPLCTVVGGLKPDLAAAVLVVVHLNAAAPSVLDRILQRCGSIPVSFASDGDVLEAGRIYLAPADHHLTVAEGRVSLVRTPTVNAVRPSVDVLFRSLAAAYGARCVGVILSGTRDDGAAGLHAIKEAGGHTVVQDPAEAVFSGMPNSACKLAAPDVVVTAAGIPDAITAAVERLAADLSDEGGDGGDPLSDTGHPAGRPSELACPECGGVLWEESGGPVTFRCRVGHAYSPDSLVSRHSQKLEEVLWSAVVALEERADLFGRVAQRLTQRSTESVRQRYEKDAAAAARDAQALKAVVMSLEHPPSPAD